MPVIQTTDAQRKLQARYGLEGAPPAPTLAPEIVPVTIVDDLSILGGSGQPGGVGIPGLLSNDPFTPVAYEKNAQSVAPGVGKFAQTVFSNPKGSGVTALITGWSGTSNTDLSVIFGAQTFTDEILIASNRGYLRDLRAYPILVPPITDEDVFLSRCGLTSHPLDDAPTQNRPSIKIVAGGASNTAGDIRYLGYILRPNSWIDCVATVSNQTTRTHWIWSERALLPGEPDGT